MATIAKKPEDFDKIEPGSYGAVCVGVFDIGTHVGQYQGKPTQNRQVIVAFEIDEEIKKGDFAGKRYMMNKWYTLSLGEKANLRKDLESWRSKPFTIQELQGFDLDKLIGVPCMLSIGSGKTEDKRIIKSISPLPKGMTPITQKEPLSQKYMDFIASQRAKSLEATGQQHSDDRGDVHPPDDIPIPNEYGHGDGLPF